jgi:2-polyprenyl-3-methyl-5-hydroxy-6-metoxy-1,4-benzoquinol methylase
MNRTLLGSVLAVTLILLFQMTREIPSSFLFTDYIVHEETSLPTSGITTGWDPTNPLGIPKGKAQNLPSIRVEDSDVDKKRKIYGGAGDKKHLGGFTEVDLDGISPDVWKHMVTKYGVKSVLDVGCGRGVSSLWFHLHGVDVLCAEGSHDAVERTMLPDPANQVVEHDFSRGPWWPEKTYSACWAVEFLEHVSYVPALVGSRISANHLSHMQHILFQVTISIQLHNSFPKMRPHFCYIICLGWVASW